MGLCREAGCRPDTPRSVRVVRVVEVKAARGMGIDAEDPLRVVTQYWSPDGEFLAENDPGMGGGYGKEVQGGEVVEQRPQG